jgi:hypothetical protein
MNSSSSPDKSDAIASVALYQLLSPTFRSKLFGGSLIGSKILNISRRETPWSCLMGQESIIVWRQLDVKVMPEGATICPHSTPTPRAIKAFTQFLKTLKFDDLGTEFHMTEMDEGS